MNFSNKEVNSIIELVEDVANRSPEAIALIEEKSGQTLTYKSLIQKANTLSRKIKKMLVYPTAPIYRQDTPLVSILTNRGACSIVAMLAVMKAGGAYVPIDPFFPEDRQLYILNHSKSQLVIVEDILYPKLLGMGDHSLLTLVINNETCEVDNQDKKESQEILQYVEETSIPNNIENLAYVLYTSGSTGKPKGVMVKNKGLINVVKFFSTELALSDRDVVMGLTTFCFDISVLEVFMPLISGSKLLVISSTTQKNPLKIIEALSRYHVSVMQATPTTYEMMIACDWNGDKNIRFLVGGEAFRPKVLTLLTHSQAVYNVYGPTETTIWSSYFKIPEDIDMGTTGIPIGTPISQTQFYLVWEGKEMHGDDAEGELWIGGDGVAEGYIYAPEKTAQSFVTNPFGSGIVYRTGDLFQRNTDGSYVFIRRLDDQVKVAGFRIELGEVETALTSHSDVDQAVAVVSEQRLFAFIRLKEEEPDQSALIDFKDALNLERLLKDFMKNKVPHYMIPHRIFPIDKFPTTANGKLDRLSLGRLAQESSSTDDSCVKECSLQPTIEVSKSSKSESTAAHSMASFVSRAIKSIKGISTTPSMSFAAIGVDSLMALLFRNFLSQQLGGISISLDQLYDPDTTIGSFSVFLWDKLREENPSLLETLGITRALDELDVEEGGEINGPQVNKQEDSGLSFNQSMLDKRVMLEGLRGLLTVLVLIDHFFKFNFIYGKRIEADTRMFIILTGWMTAIGDLNIQNSIAETSNKRPSVRPEWKPFKFLFSRAMGLFPIYWLVIALMIPYIYVMFPEQNMSQSSFGTMMFVMVIGMESWTSWQENYIVGAVHYVSLIWAVFLIYSLFKTVQYYSWNNTLLRYSGYVSLIGILVITNSFYFNSHGFYPPFAFFYFALGYLVANFYPYVYSQYQKRVLSYCNVGDNKEFDILQHLKQDSLSISSLFTVWRKWVWVLLPSILTDLLAFVLLFLIFFNFRAHLPTATYTAFDSFLMIYGNPILFLCLLFVMLLQPKGVRSIFSLILHKGVLPAVLGECSLAIYIIQLTFVSYYIDFGVKGFKFRQYPYTREFYNHHYPSTYENANTDMEALRWLIFAVALTVIIGMLIQYGFQDRVVVRIFVYFKRFSV